MSGTDRPPEVGKLGLENRWSEGNNHVQINISVSFSTLPTPEKGAAWQCEKL